MSQSPKSAPILTCHLTVAPSEGLLRFTSADLVVSLCLQVHGYDDLFTSLQLSSAHLLRRREAPLHRRCL